MLSAYKRITDYFTLMTILAYTGLALGLLAIEQLYVQVARQCRLFEAQTERSLHTERTAVRGGGILFYVAALGAMYIEKVCLLYFLLGLSLVAFVSFLDDLRHVSKRYRLLAQATAVVLIMQQTGVFPTSQWATISVLVIGVSTLNTFNFMDGINGMTAFYGIVTVGSLWVYQGINNPANPPALLVSVSLSLLIFGCYNARRQAVCFAGDVGSITLGFIIIYALLRLINQQHTFLPFLVLAVYGIDTILTIVHRLWERQNIFQAHQLHLFQLLVHQKKHSHLAVASVYAGLQAVVNALIYVAMGWQPLAQFLLSALILTSLSITYSIVKKPLLRMRYKKKSTLKADLINTT